MPRWLATIGLIWLAFAPFIAPAQEATPERIIAIGDLHGDYEAWQDIALAADLIDRDGHWSGGVTALVQLGDIVDRGPDSLRIIHHLQQLEKEARDAGGQVIVLLGNHEAMNISGDLRYVHPGELAAFADKQSKRRRQLTWLDKREEIARSYTATNPDITIKAVRKAWFEDTPFGKLEHRQAWRAGGEIGTWAGNLPVVAKVGDTLFVHGGLSAERGLEPLSVLNARYAAALADVEGPDLATVEDLLGPLWYRGNVMRAESDSSRLSREEELSRVLSFHQAKRLVVGHTPSPAGITTDLGGRLIRIDTGIAAYYGGHSSYLEIGADGIIAHGRSSDGHWSSRILSQPSVEAAQ